MKFRPVRMEEKSGDEYSERHGNHLRVCVRAAVRRVKGPAGIRAAVNQRVHRENSAHHVDVPAQKVQARESQIASADHHRDKEISENGRNRRDQEKKDHDDAVHGEQPVIGFRLHQRALRIDQMDAHQNGQGAAYKEEEGDRDQIEKRNSLVIGGKQPGSPAVIRVEIVNAGSSGWRQGRGSGGRGAHCFPSTLSERM